MGMCPVSIQVLSIYIIGREKSMNIIYSDTKKDLPSEQLQKLFVSVGWSDGSETLNMLKNYNKPFINSTLVISAWENERLIGAVRVLSDKMFRSEFMICLFCRNFKTKE
jgi:hypothetical protein